jgi:hypothetical protein
VRLGARVVSLDGATIPPLRLFVLVLPRKRDTQTVVALGVVGRQRDRALVLSHGIVHAPHEVVDPTQAVARPRALGVGPHRPLELGGGRVQKPEPPVAASTGDHGVHVGRTPSKKLLEDHHRVGVSARLDVGFRELAERLDVVGRGPKPLLELQEVLVRFVPLHGHLSTLRGSRQPETFDAAGPDQFYAFPRFVRTSLIFSLSSVRSDDFTT